MNKKKALLIACPVLLLLIALILCISLWNHRTDNIETERLYLPQGTTYEALCDSVHADGTFRLMARTLGLDKRVRAGSYVVEPHMKTLALVRKLRNGQQDPVRLTIGKFRTPVQLNDYLNQKLMHNDFHVTLDSFYIIRPNTYEFYWTVTPAQFMQRMGKEYDKQSGGSGFSGTSGSSGLPESSGILPSFKEVIILASIVEEESNHNPEKPLIASVYLNRLKKGMPLQADPTVKYAVGDFSLRRILNKHLAIESPFNTYLHTGLPPAPICLPSDASVKAVLNAPETGYLYFCASDKMDGTHRFAATLSEHQRNAAAFHRALNTRGIK